MSVTHTVTPVSQREKLGQCACVCVCLGKPSELISRPGVMESISRLMTTVVFPTEMATQGPPAWCDT